ncbi:hypothetical protein F4814DRAFT_409317 [Daldinia grandis]|nr:hypothetical protein F4814DRAFT_409317 [Daldinia grandis]
MTLSDEAIIGTVSIFIMCIIASLQYIPRFIRRRNTQSPQGSPINSNPSAGLSTLESGMFYATRGVRVDTFTFWSSRMASPHQAFPNHESELDPSYTSTFPDDTWSQRRRIFVPRPNQMLENGRSN